MTNSKNERTAEVGGLAFDSWRNGVIDKVKEVLLASRMDSVEKVMESS